MMKGTIPPKLMLLTTFHLPTFSCPFIHARAASIPFLTTRPLSSTIVTHRSRHLHCLRPIHLHNITGWGRVQYIDIFSPGWINGPVPKQFSTRLIHPVESIHQSHIVTFSHCLWLVCEGVYRWYDNRSVIAPTNLRHGHASIDQTNTGPLTPCSITPLAHTSVHTQHHHSPPVPRCHTPTPTTHSTDTHTDLTPSLNNARTIIHSIASSRSVTPQSGSALPSQRIQ